MASLKPIDAELILESAANTGAIVTVENHSIIGGLGSAVADVLMDEGVGLPFKRLGVQDRFCEGGSTAYLMNKFGFDASAISQAVRAVNGEENMTFRYEFGSGNDAFETANPANPSEKIGRYGMMSSDELERVIDRANTAQAEWAKSAWTRTIPASERFY